MAKQTVTRLVRWTTVWALALALGGCAIFQDTEEEDTTEQAEWHYEMGKGYFEANETTHAIRELTKALEINAEYAEAHYLLGFIYMGRRDNRRAMRHFRETLRIEPDYHFAKNNLGTVYLAMERWEDAVELFDELLNETLYTTPELAHNNMGWAYFNMDRHSEALEHFRMAIYLSPEMCLAENNQARTYEAMGNRHEAERHYRRAIEKCPRNYQEPHFYLGRMLQEQGDENGRSHFERCIEISSRNDLAERCRQYLQIR